MLQAEPQVTSTPPEDLTASEAAEQLHAWLDRLRPKDRMVLTLFYLEEMDVKDIAEQTGWTRTLVKVRMHRARKKLRTLMIEAGLGE